MLQYEWSSAAPPAFTSFLRSSFPSVLEAKLNEFPKALIAANGLDGGSGGGASSSGTNTPSGGASAAAAAAPGRYSPLPPGEVRQPKPDAKSQQQSTSRTPTINSASVNVEARLQVSADDLWELLTDERKIPMWARSPAEVRQAKPSKRKSAHCRAMALTFFRLLLVSGLAQTDTLDSFLLVRRQRPRHHRLRRTPLSTRSKMATSLTELAGRAFRDHDHQP